MGCCDSGCSPASPLPSVVVVVLRVWELDEATLADVEAKRSLGTEDDCWVELKNPQDYPDDLVAQIRKFGATFGGDMARLPGDPLRFVGSVGDRRYRIHMDHIL